ncbi:hypothetical protein PF010_g21829 [Phytophthora fragariae]|uniref:Uncharacterized protein n=1 Tax=Phytophthora fragariae TaxID=53985 RepID=A0A6A3HIY3_9STRA|nr:hypothetical protein PF011_g27017 [Phytophthora fragariae]KAE9081841.1 hypothetical protein PF010_g21829 [Phytophthora fragariae]
MVQETDQARDDAIEAQNLAESARVRAAAAEAAATRSERLHHLESLGCGAPRSATPKGDEHVPWSTRRQLWQRGGSDSASAADTAPAQRSSQERRA